MGKYIINLSKDSDYLKWQEILWRNSEVNEKKHDVIIQQGDPSQHRSRGIVERLNRTLADRLFRYQYRKELR